MKNYYAWSIEHEGRFWKYNNRGYTTFLKLARKFTEKEIRERQQSYPPNFLPMSRVAGKFIIPDCNEVVICADDSEAIEFAKQHSIRKFGRVYQKLIEASQLSQKDVLIMAKED